MKCKQCGNNVKVNFSGHCSTSCRDHKPMRIVPNPRYELVDASVPEDAVLPLRSKLIADFKAVGLK